MLQLTGEQVNELALAIKSAFPTKEKLRISVFQAATFDVYDHASSTLGYDQFIWALFFELRKSKLLRELIVALHDSHQGSPELNAFVDSLPPEVLRPKLNPTTDPYKTCCLWGSSKIPFVNRQELRFNLRQLAQPGGMPVAMVVNGGKGSGKSYTARMIEFISNKYAEIDVLAIHLDDMTEPAKLDAGSMMELISLNLAFDVTTMPAQSSGDAKWADELCAWFAGKMRIRSMELAAIPGKIVPTLWLLIDGIDNAGLPASTDFLIKGLVKRSGDNFPKLRVVLIDYREPLVTIQPRLETEDIRIPGRTDLRDFFVELLAIRQKQVADIDQLVQSHIEEIVSQLAADEEKGLHRLPELLGKIEKQILEGI